MVASRSLLLSALIGAAAAAHEPAVVPLAAPPHPHSIGATSLLPDGRLLFFAGEFDTDAGTTDLLDPFLGGWSTSGSTPGPHAYIGAATLPSGEVLSMDVGVEPCILYAPDAGAWRTCVPPAATRDVNQLIVLPAGGALYIGGRDEASGPTAAVDRFDPLQEQWTAEPPMSEVRTSFAGALLDDGTILVVGAGTATVSTERRALDGGWMDGGSLPDPAASPCLVRLWDGRVLAGDPGRSLLYDPGTATWSELSGAGGLNDCAAAALLPDGHVASAFGSPATAWFFDPLAETWQPGPALDVSGTYSGLLPTGRWAILDVSAVDLLDPASEHWLAAPPPPSLADAASLTLLSDGEVLQVGGTAGVASSEVFRFASGSWRAAAPLHLARSGHHATLLADGRVLITGGTDASGAPRSEPELYDPVSDIWTLLPAATATGAPHSATPLLDGRVLIVSGSTASFFDPATLSFQGNVALTASRIGHTATRLLDGRVLLAGGGTATSELFTPGPDSSAPSGDMSAARTDASAVLLPGGEVLVLGGTSAELWTPTSGTWTAAGTLATSRTGQGALLLRNGKVLLIGGDTGSGPAEPELFDPIAQSGTAMPAGIAPTVQARATRLGDGRVLLVGTTGAQYLDEGRGGLALAPALTSAAIDGGTLIVTGSGWLSAPQGVDGQLSSASANVPVLYLERPDTLEIRPAPLSSWTNQGGLAPVAPSLGTTGAFVVVSGVPSVQQLFHVGLADAGCASPAACATRRCEANVCCQACADGTCRVGGCPGTLPDAGSDGGVDGGQGPPRDLLVRCGCGAGGIGPLLFGLMLLLLLGRRRHV